MFAIAINTFRRCPRLAVQLRHARIEYRISQEALFRIAFFCAKRDQQESTKHNGIEDVTRTHDKDFLYRNYLCLIDLCFDSHLAFTSQWLQVAPFHFARFEVRVSAKMPGVLNQMTNNRLRIN